MQYPRRVQVLNVFCKVREIRTREEHTDAGHGGHTTFEGIQTRCAASSVFYFMLITHLNLLYQARALPSTPWLTILHLFDNRIMMCTLQFVRGKMVAANHPPGRTRHLPQSPISHRYPSRRCLPAGRGPVFSTRTTSAS